MGMGRGVRKKRGELDFSGIAKATRMSCSNIFPKTTNGIICSNLKNLPCLPHPDLTSSKAKGIPEGQILPNLA